MGGADFHINVVLVVIANAKSGEKSCRINGYSCKHKNEMESNSPLWILAVYTTAIRSSCNPHKVSVILAEQSIWKIRVLLSHTLNTQTV